MSAHTSGPWHYSKGGRVHSEVGELLASAWHPEAMPDASADRQLGESWLDARDRLAPERDRIEAEMEANARLIAAAPDLLAALRELLAAEIAEFPPHEAGGEAQDAWAMRKTNAQFVAIQTIAKAIGAQP